MSVSYIYFHAVCYEMASKIAIGFQMFSCLSGNYSEFHAFIKTCSDAVWFTPIWWFFPVTAYHVNPDKVLALQCNACCRQECSLCCFTRAQSWSHIDRWGWTECPHALASCLSVAWRENVEKWLFISAFSAQLLWYIHIRSARAHAGRSYLWDLLPVHEQKNPKHSAGRKKGFSGLVKCELLIILLPTPNKLGNIYFHFHIIYIFYT